MEEIPGKRAMSKIQLTDDIFGPALDDVSKISNIVKKINLS